MRIAEHDDIRLPVMVCMDGFIISHSIESMEFLKDEEVRKFIGEFKPTHPLLDIDNPVTYGPLVLPDYFMEFKRSQHEAMSAVKRVALEVAEDFRNVSGRSYGLFEIYRLDDAEIALVLLNSAAGTAKDVVDAYRERGLKVGLLKPRLFRPFPYEEVAEVLNGVKVVGVLDRADSFGGFGPLFMEIASAMMTNSSKPLMVNKVYGLGGRDFMPEHAETIIDELREILDTGKVKVHKEYIGVRE
jgi:pyruvate ferredoxin oxidoreductase alpha subunit